MFPDQTRAPYLIQGLLPPGHTCSRAHTMPPHTRALTHALATIIRDTLAINRAINASATIHKLPMELLGEIFRLLVAEEPKSRRPLFVIINVCAHWKAIAFAISSFWVNIDLSWSREMCTSLFERSKTRPLNIVIASEVSRTRCAPLLAGRVNSRVKTLHLSFHGDRLWRRGRVSPELTVAMSTLQRGFSNLRTLRITKMRNQPQPSFGISLPQLRCLELYECYTCPSIATEHVVDLKVVHCQFSIVPLFRILRSISALKSFVVTGCWLEYDEAPDSRDLATLASLEKLVVSHGWMHKVVSDTAMPNLRTLCLENMFDVCFRTLVRQSTARFTTLLTSSLSTVSQYTECNTFYFDLRGQGYSKKHSTSSPKIACSRSYVT